MIGYRRATAADAGKLAELRIAMLCEGTEHTEEFCSLLRRNTVRYLTEGMGCGGVTAWVAVRNEDIVAAGCAGFFLFPPNDWCPGGKTAYIGNMYTSPDCRGQGIAARLLSSLIGEAKERGCERILLHATESGRPLYEKFGFAESPAAMAYYPFGINPIT